MKLEGMIVLGIDALFAFGDAGSSLKSPDYCPIALIGLVTASAGIFVLWRRKKAQAINSNQGGRSNRRRNFTLNF